jgi:hypothetical protein
MLGYLTQQEGAPGSVTRSVSQLIQTAHAKCLPIVAFISFAINWCTRVVGCTKFVQKYSSACFWTMQSFQLASPSSSQKLVCGFVNPFAAALLARLDTKLKLS